MTGLASKKMVNKADLATELIGVLFMGRDYAHMAHLKTSSYSKHRVLDKFYTELLELTDEFAEVAQGMFGKLDIKIPLAKGNTKDPINTLQKHMEMIEDIAYECEARALNKVVDDISVLYYRTIYLLSELD